MNDPRRLVDEGSPHAESLRDAGLVRTLSPYERERLRRRLESPEATSQTSVRFGVAFAAAACAGALLTALLWSVFHPASEIDFAAGATVAQADQPVPQLVSGQAVIHTKRQRSLRAGPLQVSIFAGRAALAVTEGEASVEVFEGSAEVARGRQRVALSRGDRVTSNDARLLPEPLVTEPPRPAGSCTSEACLNTAAQGDDVPAQLALLQLALGQLRSGQMVAAERSSRDLLTRFAQGVMTPEAHLVHLQALMGAGQSRAGLEEAAQWLKQNAEAPAAPRVALLMGDVSLSEGDAAAAQTAYLRVLSLRPSTREAVDAWRGVAMARENLGLHPEAREAWFKALELMPEGPLRQELENRLVEP